MDRDPYADMFRFPIGAYVHWVEYPTERYYVGQRRWTQREILAPLVEYRLRLSKTTGGLGMWINEQDVLDGEESSDA